MLFPTKPNKKNLLKILNHSKCLSFTYKCVGSTYSCNTIPEGFSSNRYKKILGKGDHIFKKAINAISNCKMYSSHHSELFRIDDSQTPLPGTTMIVLARNFLLWTANPVRMIYEGYRTDNNGLLYSIAVGTLPGHVEIGEERFTIRQDAHNDVWYELFSFYKPSKFLLRLAYPAVWYVLWSFDRNSAGVIKKYARD